MTTTTTNSTMTTTRSKKVLYWVTTGFAAFALTAIGAADLLDGLLQAVPSDHLVAIVRSPEKAGRFASRGVRVRRGDYSAPETLASALAGVKRLLLVSATDLGKRFDQHRAVIEAAKAAGVELIAYTSVLRADSSTLPIAGEHKLTEGLLRGSGIPYVILRNGWYIENYG